MLLIIILGNEFKFAGVSLSCAGRESTPSTMEITLVDSTTTSASSSSFSSFPRLLFFSYTGSSIALLSVKLWMNSWNDMLHLYVSALKIFLACWKKEACGIASWNVLLYQSVEFLSNASDIPEGSVSAWK